MLKELKEKFIIILKKQRFKENFVLPDFINSLIHVSRLEEVYKNLCVRNLRDIINQRWVYKTL